LALEGPKEWKDPLRLNDSKEKQDENDEQDEADAAAAVVTESWTQAITSKTEHQNQDDKKDQHFRVSMAAKIRSLKTVMQFSRYV
jgi:hypothetical protein